MIDFTKYQDYIPLETPKYSGQGYSILGHFPYETARVTLPVRVKIQRGVASNIENLAKEADIADNKIVIICRDMVGFGTTNFAVFLHDAGCVFGAWEQVMQYNNTPLKLK